MKRLALFLAPLLVAGALFASVLSIGGAPFARKALPDEPLRSEVCTWHCHNHSCPHRPKLPAWLTSDRGLFGGTIRTLFRIGGLMSADRGIGYGLANLSIFCVAWPAFTYGLYAIVLSQRATLKRLREKASP